MNYTLSPNRFFIIRDKPIAHNPLELLFKDSHAIFKMRVQQLGNDRKKITDEESETLRIMLEALISAKKQLSIK